MPEQKLAEIAADVIRIKEKQDLTAQYEERRHEETKTALNQIIQTLNEKDKRLRDLETSKVRLITAILVGFFAVPPMLVYATPQFFDVHLTPVSRTLKDRENWMRQMYVWCREVRSRTNSEAVCPKPPETKMAAK